MNKKEAKKIWEQVKATNKAIEDLGWKRIFCDNYDKSHFLKSDSFYSMEGIRILCRNCIIEERGLQPE